MILKSDVVFLIEEYAAKFGQPPRSVTGTSFPRSREWGRIVRTLRQALDSGKPLY